MKNTLLQIIETAQAIQKARVKHMLSILTVLRQILLLWQPSHAIDPNIMYMTGYIHGIYMTLFEVGLELHGLIKTVLALNEPDAVRVRSRDMAVVFIDTLIVELEGAT